MFEAEDEEFAMKASDFSRIYKTQKIKPRNLILSKFLSEEHPEIEFLGIYDKWNEIKHLGYMGCYIPIKIRNREPVVRNAETRKVNVSDADMPHEPGKCYARCLIQDQYEDIYETISDQEESTKLELIDAVYEEKVINGYKIVAGESDCDQKIIDSLKTKVKISDAETRLEIKEAIYEIWEDEIEIAPASTKWIKKKTDKNCLSPDPNDCLVWCLSETPAEYKIVEILERVGCEDGWEDRGGDCAREYEQVAEYTYTLDSLAILELSKLCPNLKIEPEVIIGTSVLELQSSKLVTIPATYKTAHNRSLVKAGGFTEWREVVCEADRTPQLISNIKQALALMGYHIDVNENDFDSSLNASLIKFQKDRSLPVGQLDYETLEALGVK